MGDGRIGLGLAFDSLALRPYRDAASGFPTRRQLFNCGQDLHPLGAELRTRLPLTHCRLLGCAVWFVIRQELRQLLPRVTVMPLAFDAKSVIPLVDVDLGVRGSMCRGPPKRREAT